MKEEHRHVGTREERALYTMNREVSHRHSVRRSVVRRKGDRLTKKAEMFNSCFVPFFNKKVSGNHTDIKFNKGMRCLFRTGKEESREYTRLEYLLKLYGFRSTNSD